MNYIKDAGGFSIRTLRKWKTSSDLEPSLKGLGAGKWPNRGWGGWVYGDFYKYGNGNNGVKTVANPLSRLSPVKGLSELKGISLVWKYLDLAIQVPHRFPTIYESVFWYKRSFIRWGMKFFLDFLVGYEIFSDNVDGVWKFLGIFKILTRPGTHS